MSIIVKGISKKFGSQTAVNDLHFSASPGEIVGFLGPNGAGKSTTMKMLCCYLNPTSGTAEICGYDIHEDPLMVRRNIGYLPEHNPLYEDMYVREFLAFVCGIHEIQNPDERINEVIEITGLEKEQYKLIGELSKGYKQRVGLAQAIIHDPKVLILDEPTSGLDMNQLVGIRQLIKDMGKEKTVIFSSHIMQEVQALCDRVIIIHEGNLVADDSIATLQSKVSEQNRIFIEFAENEFSSQAFKDIKGVLEVAKEENKVTIISKGDVDIKPEIFKKAVECGLTITEMKSDKLNIESIFRALTKNETV